MLSGKVARSGPFLLQETFGRIPIESPVWGDPSVDVTEPQKGASKGHLGG